jgi:hypothetical protein
MATIDGPKVQMPPANSPFTVPVGDEYHNLTPESAQFLHAVQQIVFYSSRSGPTGSRPTGTTQRWIGMPYFDTTLGLPVFLSIASTNVWVNAAGAPV